MGGIDFRHDSVYIDRSPNDLDALAITFSEILESLAIDHVFVSGYVAILTGRARATQDIEVVLERIDSDTISELIGALEQAGLWGPAMPLAEMSTMIEDNIWIAREDEMVPHLDVSFATDQFDEASLRHRIDAHIGDATLPIGPIELQIAYKLWMGSDRDFEDAVHLFSLFRESLTLAKLETWVQSLDVKEAYDRLIRT